MKTIETNTIKPFSIKPIAAACAIAMATATMPVLAESDNERSSDVWTKASLTTTYTLSRHLNPFKIDTEVKDGVATLRGTVDSDVERDLAEELALGVDGIREVNNELKVSPDASEKYYADQRARRDARNTSEGDADAHRSFMRKVEDANITAKVKSQLLWNGSTSGLAVDVDTRNGRVTLNGDVESEAEAELAEQIAHNTDDVRGVENKLRVTGKKDGIDDKAARKAREVGEGVSDSWITTKVKSALLYNRNVDGSDINVETQNGIVTLRGQVDSDFEKERAVSIARNVTGVKDVKLKLDTERSDSKEQHGYNKSKMKDDHSKTKMNAG
tara:strand:- start:129 stop:1115 length:987 start_codon:yes stop_codon:yes gene_type:complete